MLLTMSAMALTTPAFQAGAFQADTFYVGNRYDIDHDGASYAVAGQDATLSWGRQFPAGAGTYATTGYDSTAHFDRVIIAAQGAYTVTPSPVLAHRVVAFAGAAYSVAGGTNNLVHGYQMLADTPGSYAFSGYPARMIKLRFNPHNTVYIARPFERRTAIVKPERRTLTVRP